MIIADSLLIFTTVGQFIGHYKMMIRWYKENPKDGLHIARSIQVGIPPDLVQRHNLNSSDAIIGLTVPEADREV